MSIKNKDRRRIAWSSFIWLITAPLQARLIDNTEIIIFVIPSLVAIIIANWFSKPTNSIE